MSRAGRDGGGGGGGAERRRQQRCPYKGVRRRAWGKWVSEIRVPGTRERLWLGSYASPEAAAVAHDAAACLLRRRAALPHHHRLLNFPDRAAASCYHDAYHRGHGQRDLSPRSVQRVASDAGMAADAQIVHARAALIVPPPDHVQQAAIDGAPRGVGLGATAQGAAYAPPPPLYSNGASDTSSWTAPSASRSSSAGNEQPLVYGDISVDDIEILI